MNSPRPNHYSVRRHPIERLIEKADLAIIREDFNTLIEIYSDDAVLVVKPGLNAISKDQIRNAFEAIAAHFHHNLNVQQAGMRILEAGDAALVLAKTVISAPGQPTVHRDATYVFRKGLGGDWLCVIDNSYGHELFSHLEA